MGQPHQIKPLLSPGIVPLCPMLPADPCGKPVCFFVDPSQNALRNLLRLCGLYPKPHPVDLMYTPHFQTVRHVLIGAFHSAAGCCADDNCLLPAHFRPGTMHHPPGSKVIQQAHYLPGGMVNIHRTVQNDDICFQQSICQRLQLLEMRTVLQGCLETGITPAAGLVKVLRQKEFRDCSLFLHALLYFFHQFPGNHAGTPPMGLSVNHRELHVFSPSSRAVLSIVNVMHH